MKINITAWIETFNSTGKLPEQRIPCSNESCTTSTTCFGANLDSKIAKHGGLMNLLTTFECRECRSASKPAKVKPVRAPRASTKQEEPTQSTPRVNINATPTRFDFKNESDVQELTSGQCQRPDIFLDNDRACDGCGLYAHCACTSKRLAA